MEFLSKRYKYVWKKLDVTHMVFALGLVMVASYFGNKFRQTFTEGEQRDEYELVKKYLLKTIYKLYDVNAVILCEVERS